MPILDRRRRPTLPLSELESHVLSVILGNRFHAVKNARVVARSYCGAGLVTELRCTAYLGPFSALPTVHGVTRDGGRVSFVVFLRGGRLDRLDGCTTADTWPRDIVLASIQRQPRT